jgi:hypothetical protein
VTNEDITAWANLAAVIIALAPVIGTKLTEIQERIESVKAVQYIESAALELSEFDTTARTKVN